MKNSLAQLPLVFTLANEFSANMRLNFLAALFPGALILAGTIFLGWGLTVNTLLYQISVPFALYNTMRPLLQQKVRITQNEHKQDLK